MCCSCSPLPPTLASVVPHTGHSTSSLTSDAAASLGVTDPSDGEAGKNACGERTDAAPPPLPLAPAPCISDKAVWQSLQVRYRRGVAEKRCSSSMKSPGSSAMTSGSSASRCCEHAAHTTRPHRRQWCLRVRRPKRFEQRRHSLVASSGSHRGRIGRGWRYGPMLKRAPGACSCVGTRNSGAIWGVRTGRSEACGEVETGWAK